jgi:hypothetical protein
VQGQANARALASTAAKKWEGKKKKLQKFGKMPKIARGTCLMTIG